MTFVTASRKPDTKVKQTDLLHNFPRTRISVTIKSSQQ